MVVLTLLLPFLTLALVSRAVAQVAVLPSWAVVEFRNVKSPGTPFGRVAAEAIASELGKTGQYEIIPQETIERTVKNLGVSTPPESTINLLRIAQDARASTVVNGEIIDYRILSEAGGKQAVVQMRTVVYDVASGLAVNGTVTTSRSTVRPGDVTDEALINDAIQQGAGQAIRDIQGRQLPTGTVLNTGTTSALINKGTRSGFNVGQQVVVLRGREQVATARVSDVEPDSATVRIERSTKGIQPGDRVRAIFDVPVVTSGGIAADGTPRVQTRKRSGSNAGLVTVLLVLGLVAALLGGGGGSDQDVASEVRAEALMYPDVSGAPAVRVSWTGNGFAGGNANRFAWQVYRNDIQTSPVLVVSGSDTSGIDTTENRNVTYTTRAQIGGITCDASNNNAGATGVIGVRPGRAYVYSVELVYSLSSLDLPDGGSTGTTANGGGTGTTATGTGTTATGTGTGTTATGTGTTATGTGTTATGTGTTATGTGTTATGGGTGGAEQRCYFVSRRTSARGVATPLNPPVLRGPDQGGSAGPSVTVSFQSVVTTFPIAVEYLVQFSPSNSFPRNQTWNASRFTRTETGTIVAPTVDTFNAPNFIRNIPEGAPIYWRVGARNVNDRPGPVPDATTRERYIFSQWRNFSRPLPPPPPPAN